ncbi:transcription factor TFIIE alpha subunit [Schizosaccharomyces cryophilus OY26]|uniref:Transcription factor TFIIE alpha subunit n=1 Tax=Schizosaccharomyces cryophilus (strain OY26 / ATCC MYA-4695 / CBS 11777 / NBRC 106824 / NRRL Y48691) TaxID=653667 RepID=S9X071_SCHCR|nr:transcription factor TFIIE alpha subunit [Schizosaccharomyces cryophilus OY26]EPY50327.1 transcription factor TFIIE alpha subunit [Schizosaccharomyces cryophilus OY26]
MSNAPEVVQRLIKMIMRAFYETRHIIFMDAILRHSALTDEQSAILMGIPIKECRFLAGKLREDRLLAIQSRAEVKEGQQRQIQTTYFYIDYCFTIDSIKWRMHQLVKTVEDRMRSDFDSKGYVCPFCQKKYSSLDVLSLVTPEGTFLCSDCATELKDDEESAEMMSSQKRLGRLMGQVSRIIEALKQVDEIVVPQNNFQSALERAVPISMENQNITSQTLPKSSTDIRHATSSPSITVDFSADAESAEDARVKNLDKQAAALQNTVPEWHAMSTISGGITRVGAKNANNNISSDTVDEEEDKKKDFSTEKSALDAYYASLRAKKQSSDIQQEPSINIVDDEDEDEEDFEDVPSLPSTTPVSHIKRKQEDPNYNDSDNAKKTKTEDTIANANSLHTENSEKLNISDDDNKVQNVIINDINENVEDDEDDADFEDV